MYLDTVKAELASGWPSSMLPLSKLTLIGGKCRLNTARRNYAEELKYVAHIGSGAIVRAFAKVQREKFLGPGPWRIAWGEKGWITEDNDPKHLYHNILVAIDPARGLNNGQPGFLASLMDALELKAGEHMAHIGCGTGYYCAILAEVVGKKGRVTAVEIDQKLAARAKRNSPAKPPALPERIEAVLQLRD